MDFLTNMGLNPDEFFSLLFLIIAGGILLLVLWFVLRVTRKVLRLGCLSIVLVLGAALLFFWLT